jgi:L-ascorbate metabolism protein UlaG (beta-lactamase superfamily)
MQALRDIQERSPNVQFLVPEGVRSLIIEELAASANRVSEMDWWNSVSYSGDAHKVEFVCTPAQHNSGEQIVMFIH